MKVPRILVLATLAASMAASVAGPASAQTIFYGDPPEIGYMYTYYSNSSKTAVVSVNFLGCNGVETWDGYGGYDDLTITEHYDYVEWNC